MRTAYRLTFLVLTGMLVSACGTQPAPYTPAPPGTPTATPLPTISLKSPVLGGSFQAFINLFDNNQGCPNAWVYQTKEGSACISLDWPNKTIYEPDDPNTRMTGIAVSPDAKWNMSQEQQALAQFMPPDAKLQNTKTAYLGNIATGTEETYTSVLLARTLPKVDFTDANGNQAQPGTFYVLLVNGLSGYETNIIGTDEKFVLGLT